MRRVLAVILVLGLIAAACGDDESSSTTVAAATTAGTSSTTSTEAPSTTEAATTTTSSATTSSTTSTTTASTTSTTSTTATTTTTVSRPSDRVLASTWDRHVYGSEEIIELPNGRIALTRPWLEWEGVPELAQEVNVLIDEYVDGLVADFTATDAMNDGEYPNEFGLSVEVTLLAEYHLSLRYEEYWGVAMAAHPFVDVTTQLFDQSGGALLPPEQVLSAWDVDDPIGELIERVGAKVVDEIGETFGARIHVDAMALFEDGIEVTIDEVDGIPHVFGPVTVRFHWYEIIDLMDFSQSWWLLASTVMHAMHIVLNGDGLSVALFGMGVDDVYSEFELWYGEPITDTGWGNPWGTCIGDTRSVTWRVWNGVELIVNFATNDPATGDVADPYFAEYWLVATDVATLDRRVMLPSTTDFVTVGMPFDEVQGAVYGDMQVFQDFGLMGFLPDGQLVGFDQSIPGNPAYFVTAGNDGCTNFD